MFQHQDLSKQKLHELIDLGQISLGGYRPLKIFGRLDCESGKRMKRENRVFFRDESEALEEGYRPCGNCMTEKYRAWKEQNR